ncbi:MerR family transcriptional regulator [Actinokineospora guangxiensis]|uniref:MerR family transcriptional regulator n=1 Tax=Actinokineospora guangxiensis TaxID=1490288 RepID=A0ABW0ER18_9PSEU
MDDELLTIGQLARRTGVPVRTLRFWSDDGTLTPADRSPAGYRRYGVDAVARVELIRALRELGFGLDEVGHVLAGRTTLAQVADAHVAALDARIRALKVSRAVLSTVSRRGSTAEETTVMNRLARLSATERARVIEEFKEEVFGPLDLQPRVRDRLRDLAIDLPEDPTPDQVDAWIELADLVQDEDFRTRMRAMLELTAPRPGEPAHPAASIWWARHIVTQVADARRRGAGPDSPAAADLLTDLFGQHDRAAVLAGLEAGLAARAEHYRVLVARVRGGRSAPDATADLEWLADALRRTVPGGHDHRRAPGSDPLRESGREL